MRIFFLLLFLLLPCVVVQAQDVAGEQIISFDVALTVQSNSSVDIVETIVYDFGENERRGIYREIPYRYKARGGNFSLQISDVVVRDTKRRILETRITRKDGNLTIRIGDEDLVITGRETYTISYTVRRAINFFDDYDELYWNVTGDKWTVPILSSSATVRLAQSFDDDSAFVQQDCFVGVFGSKENCTIDQGAQGVFRARQLLLGEGLTIVSGFQKGVVEQPTMQEAFINFLRDNLIILLPFVGAFFMLIVWYRCGRDPQITGARSVVAQWEIPQVSGRDLRPYEVGIVVDEFSNRGDFSSLFIDLAIRGYYTIEKIEKKWILGKSDYRLTKAKDWTDDPALERFERIFLDGVFGEAMSTSEVLKKRGAIPTDQEGRTMQVKELPRKELLGKKLLAKGKEVAAALEGVIDVPTMHKEEVLISSLRNVFYKKYEDVVREGYENVSNRGLFVKNPSRVRALYVYGSVFASLIALIILQAFLGGSLGWVFSLSIVVSILMVGFFGLIMPRKTMNGVRTHRKILGLKKYLEAAEKRPLEMMQSPDAINVNSSAVFEKYLPYAMVLGVEKQWAKQFEDVYDARDSSWFRGGNTGDFSAGGMSTMTKGFAVAAGAAALSKPSSASAGGSGFSGGGSGGGGGGGGGGSW